MEAAAEKKSEQASLPPRRKMHQDTCRVKDGRITEKKGLFFVETEEEVEEAVL